MHVDYRRLLVPGLVALVGLIGAAVFWVTIQTPVRFALWTTVSEWQPSTGEQRRLAECRPPGWWTWLKVLAQDREVSCGEVWAIQSLSEKVVGQDREDWLRSWVAEENASPLRRLRAALALSVAGRTVPAEPAWLSQDPALPDLQGPGYAAAVAEDQAWGVHLGPRWMALGTLWAMSESGLPPAEAIGPLEAVLAVKEPGLANLAVSAVARGLQAPPDLPEEARYRRSKGRTPRPMPSGWLQIIQREPECASPCLELWLELLGHEAARENAGDPLNDPVATDTLQPLAGLLGYQGVRERALEWWIRAAVRWISASPEPASRLASVGLGAADGTPDPVATLWDRSATPWMTAAVLHEVGKRGGLQVEVRVDDSGGLWMWIGSEVVSTDLCGGSRAEEPPNGEPLPVWSLHAAALAEAALAAPPAEAAALATAASRLDPLVAGGLVDRWIEASDASPATRRGTVVGASLAHASASGGPAEAMRETAAAFVTQGCGSAAPSGEADGSD